MRVAFYCQNLLGIGHLTRSLAICRDLVNHMQVHFIQGGPEVGKTISHKNFHHHQLAPLLMEENDSSLYDPARKREVPEIFAERAAVLEKIASEDFQHCIVELYPFGRRKFRKEILPFIKNLKKTNPNIKLHCSLRDILVESDAKKEQEAVEIVNQYFDTVLVHSDPNLFTLEHTFPLADKIASKLFYTGFVTESGASNTSPPRKNQILVSIGGGSVGLEVIEAAAQIAKELPDYQFLLVPGPFSNLQRVEGFRSKYNATNIEWLPFLKDFEATLSQSAASISLAGYNTVMNLLSTRTPALVYPYRANQEQLMRATKLQDKGLMKVLSEQDLSPSKLLPLLKVALHQNYPAFSVQLNGAQQTSQFLVQSPSK